MLKMFLVGFGTGYMVFTKTGNEMIKKYMELSNSIATKGIDAVNNMIPKGGIGNGEIPDEGDE